MRHTTPYLYDINPSVLSGMLYPNALKYKIEAAKVLRGKLLEPHFSERDDERINAVINAIKFNERLLEELRA